MLVPWTTILGTVRMNLTGLVFVTLKDIVATSTRFLTAHGVVEFSPGKPFQKRITNLGPVFRETRKVVTRTKPFDYFVFSVD